VSGCGTYSPSNWPLFSARTGHVGRWEYWISCIWDACAAYGPGILDMAVHGLDATDCLLALCTFAIVVGRFV